MPAGWPSFVADRGHWRHGWSIQSLLLKVQSHSTMQHFNQVHATQSGRRPQRGINRQLCTSLAPGLVASASVIPPTPDGCNVVHTKAREQPRQVPQRGMRGALANLHRKPQQLQRADDPQERVVRAHDVRLRAPELPQGRRQPGRLQRMTIELVTVEPKTCEDATIITGLPTVTSVVAPKQHGGLCRAE